MKSHYASVAIIAILLAVMSVILFAIPGEVGKLCGWIYAITIIIYLFGMFLSYKIMNRPQKLVFLGTPTLLIVFAAILLQTGLLFFIRLEPSVPTWIAVVLEAIIIGLCAIPLVSLSSSTPYIQGVDEKVREKVNFIRQLNMELTILSQNEDNAEVKAQLEQLISKVKYSDPMSDNSLSNIEHAIMDNVATLAEKTSADKLTSIHEIESLVLERNQKCLILK